MAQVVNEPSSETMWKELRIYMLDEEEEGEGGGGRKEGRKEGRKLGHQNMTYYA